MQIPRDALKLWGSIAGIGILCGSIYIGSRIEGRVGGPHMPIESPSRALVATLQPPPNAQEQRSVPTLSHAATITTTPGVGTAYVAARSSPVTVPWVSLRDALLENHDCNVSQSAPSSCDGHWTNYYYATQSGSSSLEYCFDNLCKPEPLAELDDVEIASSTGFSRDSAGVYLNGPQFDHVRLPIADPQTFNVLLSPAGVSGFGVDKDHVYNEFGDVIPNLDPSSIVELAEYVGAANDQEFYEFWKDKDNAYFDGASPLAPIAGADPMTFEVASDSTYAMDSAHTYCVGEPRAQSGGGLIFPLEVFPGDKPASCNPSWIVEAIRDHIL